MDHPQCFIFLISLTACFAVQFLTNPTSEMSTDDKSMERINKTEQSDESGHEIEIDEESKDKKFLDFAMKTVLDPDTVIIKHDDVENFKIQLEELDKGNVTLEIFMEEMDKLSLDVCRTSQEALWEYVTDTSSDVKKNKMVQIAAEEDEIKSQYWNIIKRKYKDEIENNNDVRLKRKLRIIKERGTNVQMPQSKQREEIDLMQRIWSRVTVCAYKMSCETEGSSLSMNDIITLFKTSNNSDELKYYWKAYRDATGKKVRPIFQDYVRRMNTVAQAESFEDAGDMWRYNFEDDNFLNTVNRLWNEVKPLYTLLHRYVRAKLKVLYTNDLQKNDDLIPGHILGNLWAQEWQVIYPLVAPYPDVKRARFAKDSNISAKSLFDTVNKYQQSLGFQSAEESYQNINEAPTTSNCLPSSHDMCDGMNYRIKWCGEKITDVIVGLSRAARLLGHVQYFRHYSNLEPLFRDGPNPAFHDALSDIVAVQLTSPRHLRTIEFVHIDDCPEVTMNHLLWLALEKIPLMAYAYSLDKWRWDVFSNSSMENLNEHWWEIRIRETKISPPSSRNESDLDPASKYHVVSHVQYITYLISNILEFQILRSLCKTVNQTGSLQDCSIYGNKEAGKLLSKGMSLGASEDWRSVLKAMTGETELSTEGILEYFAPLETFLTAEISKLERAKEDLDKSAPIIVGIIVIVLTCLMFLMYCIKKRDNVSKLFSLCGLSKNGSLDIATNELSQNKSNEVHGISEDKV